MKTGAYEIMGGDFEGAGSASSSLKELLKKTGVKMTDIRRVMIAAYEAEMNVVIHAYKGTMRYLMHPGRIDVEVVDEGPGIPDIEQAMKEGFSTAPAFARELGFGAGMGLSNIKKNTDLLALHSTVGLGTRLKFTIYLKSQAASGAAPNSVRVMGESCIECLRCLYACPTKALRVRGGRPEILEHLCIDCTVCIGACRTGALAMESSTEAPSPGKGECLVVPSAFLAQFGAGTDPQQALDVLKAMGYAEVCVTEPWERSLREAVLKHAEQAKTPKPVISPVCVAAVNLVATRYPSLLANVAPFLSPMEAIQEEWVRQRTTFVSACPSQHTAMTRKRSSAGVEVIGPSALRNAVLARAKGSKAEAKARPGEAKRSAEAPDGLLQVTGVRHVMSALETAENRGLGDVRVLELFLCDQGCFGSPLWTENPFLARERWRRAAVGDALPAKAVRRKAMLLPRLGLRLDNEMSKAMEKLAKIEETTRSLPGRDCGRCGAPTCAALAEDFVLGRASKATCVFVRERSEKKA